jgi:3-methyladenine DNA glycosylase AlkD
MHILGSKAEAKVLLNKCLETHKQFGIAEFIKQFHSLVLKKKVRFPVLEYAAGLIYTDVPQKDQLSITDKIIDLHEIGGNVIAGKILQLRLEKKHSESLRKAVDYIITGDKWYVCDIIGERVMGHALLVFPEKTIPVLKKYSTHADKWIVRCVGVATHYAVKNGLKKNYSEQMFQLLLTCSNTTDFHTKKGIGWAAKTIAKFHPDIIKKYADQVEKDPNVKQWFKTKIRIGLSRSFKYASRYTG